MRDIYKWLFGERGRDGVRRPIPPVPEALRPHAAAIAATLQPVLGASIFESPPSNPASSQLGGVPWWPKGRAWPTSRKGEPLAFLIQLNFGEMPHIVGFPNIGLLQFFIGTDDLMGADPDNCRQPPGFACVFHADVAGERETDMAALMPEDIDYSPLEDPTSALELVFEKSQMLIDPTDYRFVRLLPDVADEDELIEAYAEWVTGEAAAPAIRIGGYPTFTQEDPRSYGGSPEIGDISLLTIDSTMGIMWGDAGAAQFLIREADLAKGDFSRVVYNWDCY